MYFRLPMVEFTWGVPVNDGVLVLLDDVDVVVCVVDVEPREVVLDELDSVDDDDVED